MAESSVVELSEISRFYQSGEQTVHALDGVSLTVQRGGFVGLCGPSGSGKSTLLNIIGGLDTPTSGRALVAGRSLTELSPGELAEFRLREIGFVFQSFNLIPILSAVENVEFIMLLQGLPARQAREKALHVLKEVGLAEQAHRRPSELSGGQQQRVAVARAIVSEPALILADEPTANLDSHTAQQLLDLMNHLNREHGITFVFATHDKMVMEQARRLISLRDGKIISDETRVVGQK